MTRRPRPEDGRLLVVVRFIAAVRLCYMSLIALGAVAAAYSSENQVAAPAVLALGVAYALGLAALAVWRPEPLLFWKRLTAVDVALVAALSLSGLGGFVLGIAFPLLPFVIALVARPLATFLWSLSPVAILVAFVVVAPFVAGPLDEREAWVALASLGVFVVPALIAAAFSAARVHVERAAVENARREVLAATIVRVEARERHELADALHDGPVQHLAAAYREVSSSLQGGQGSLEDARASLGVALEQLRGEIFDLYPHVLDHGGLQAAVSELVRRSEERGGFTTSIHIDPGAVGIDDVTVMAVLRELLTNAAKHAEAGHVGIRVSNRGGSSLLVEVRDDGVGFAAQRPEQALQGRHFGLHSMGDRLMALGGALDIASTPGSGTSACARIPIDSPTAEPSEPQRRRLASRAASRARTRA